MCGECNWPMPKNEQDEAMDELVAESQKMGFYDRCGVWVSIKDRLPIKDQKVICFGSSGVFIGDYRHREKYWQSDKYQHREFTEDFEPVTHWMPLPQPPNDLSEELKGKVKDANT